MGEAHYGGESEQRAEDLERVSEHRSLSEIWERLSGQKPLTSQDIERIKAEHPEVDFDAEYPKEPWQ